MVKEGEGKEYVADPTYTKWLLEAIQKVKSQKQRPNDERICHAVRQFHKVSKESLLEQLQLAVKDGTILKVLNKGTCSYRDPQSGPPPKLLKVSRKFDLTRFIIRGIRHGGDSNGATLKQIEKYLQSVYTVEVNGTSFIEELKSSLRKGLTRNVFVKDGKFIKLTKNSDSAGTGQNIVDEDLASDYSFCFEDENKVCKTVSILLFCKFNLSCSSIASISSYSSLIVLFLFYKLIECLPVLCMHHYICSHLFKKFRG